MGLGRLFGTDGVRGVVNVELDPLFALKLGYAIGTFFGEGSRILIGRDVRIGGLMIMRAVEAGLMSAGVKVYEADLITTPALQHSIRSEGFDGGVMITASHNPPQYNGIKVLSSQGIEISRDQEREIEEIFFTSRFRKVSWSNIPYDIIKMEGLIEKYTNWVISLVDKEAIMRKRFTVVIDSANSTPSLTTPLVARKLGAKVVSINSNLDPFFPSRHPEPSPETLKETANIVANIKADIGIAHDADGDRGIVIDDKGRIHWGDRSAAILAKFLAEKHPELPKKVYTAVSSSILVEEYLKPFGIEVVWTKVGSIDISYLMLSQGGGICGFEENGGFMYPKHLIVRDGTMKLALMLELLAHERRKLSEIMDELPKYYPIKTKIPMKREVALKVVEEIKKIYSNYRMITIDGIKVFGNDFWFLVRPSGTEPILRIMVEAKDESKAKSIVKELTKIAKSVAENLEI